MKKVYIAPATEQTKVQLDALLSVSIANSGDDKDERQPDVDKIKDNDFEVFSKGNEWSSDLWED